MKIRRLLTSLLTLCALLVIVAPVLAGGWATFTLDELPGEIIAGKSVTFRYTIRQHGNKPITVEASHLVARHPESGESLTVQSTPGEAPGEHIATITFPVAGTWEWYLDGFGKQTMPDLTVLSAQTSTDPLGNTQSSTGNATSAILSRNSIPLVILGVIIAASALIFAAYRRKRWALVFVMIGLLVGAAGVSADDNSTAAQSLKVVSDKASIVQQGEALFVAKGCVTCHHNGNIEVKYQDNATRFAVDLTNYPTSLEYLRVWLKDPASVKPETLMPNLELHEAEIEALAAFLLATPAP